MGTVDVYYLPYDTCSRSCSIALPTPSSLHAYSSTCLLLTFHGCSQSTGRRGMRCCIALPARSDVAGRCEHAQVSTLDIEYSYRRGRLRPSAFVWLSWLCTSILELVATPKFGVSGFPLPSLYLDLRQGPINLVHSSSNDSPARHE